MAKKGKKKSKKQVITIEDSVLEPYYLQVEDKQYIKMRRDKTLPQGYYIKLSFALDSIAKDLTLEEQSGNKLSIRQYISQYENIKNEILNSIKA